MNLKYRLNKVWCSNTQRVMSLTVFGIMLALLMDIMIAAKLGTGQTANSLTLALGLLIVLDAVIIEDIKSSFISILWSKK